MAQVIAVDVGGTNLRVALVEGKKILKLIKRKTPRDNFVEELIKEISKLINSNVRGIGIGTPGFFDKGKFVNSPNLKIPGNLIKIVERKFKKKVFVENDGNCVALAELKYGVKKKNFLVLTIGTGIGGGIVIDGKMYKGMEETREFLRAMKLAFSKKEFAKFQKENAPELAIFPQAPCLPLVREIIQGAQMPLRYGPQNLHWEEQGAFTGEMSPNLFKELGCYYAIIGHSERRQIFAENNESAAKRAVAAQKAEMRSIFCVGETLGERDRGETFSVLEAQCAALFALMGGGSFTGFNFAYEPVWAIGTGRTATPEQAQEVHAFLRKKVGEAWGESYASQCRILYGGSVKPENSKDLLSCPDIDGALVGGASLKPESFLAIAASTE